MNAKGLTQAELARRVGVSPAAIQQLLNGSSKTSRSIRHIARELEVSVDWLEGSVVEKDLSIEKSELSISNLETVNLMYTKITKGENTNPAVNISWVTIGREWLQRISNGREDDSTVLTLVEDNDMSPTIVPGDEVLFYYLDEYDGDPDGIWVFVYNRATYFRRIRPVEGDWVSIDADNPMVASFRAKLSEITVHLKALWFGRRLTHS